MSISPFKGKWICEPRFADILPKDPYHREREPAKDSREHPEALCNAHTLFRRRFAIRKRDGRYLLRFSADDYGKVYLNVKVANTSQDLAQRYGLESASDHHGNFTITMRNLTLLDGGLYCCLVVEIRHHHSEQRLFGAMELQVQRGEPLLCGAARGGCHCGDGV